MGATIAEVWWQGTLHACHLWPDFECPALYGALS